MGMRDLVGVDWMGCLLRALISYFMPYFILYQVLKGELSRYE